MKKKFALFVTMCLLMNTAYPQLLTWTITHRQPYFNVRSYFLTEINLTNTSSDTLIIWITKDEKYNNTEQNIGKYFFILADSSDFTLSQLIYESNVNGISNVIGYSFLKELPPMDAFTIILVDSLEINNTFCSNFTNKHIVAVDKKRLHKFQFEQFLNWKKLLYPYPNILIEGITDYN